MFTDHGNTLAITENGTGNLYLNGIGLVAQFKFNPFHFKLANTGKIMLLHLNICIDIL